MYTVNNLTKLSADIKIGDRPSDHSTMLMKCSLVLDSLCVVPTAMHYGIDKNSEHSVTVPLKLWNYIACGGQENGATLNALPQCLWSPGEGCNTELVELSKSFCIEHSIKVSDH